MIHALTHTEYDLFDHYNKRGFKGRKRRRTRRKNLNKRRRPPQKFDFKGFPVKVKIPTKTQPKIVKGRPTKLPPLTNFRKSKNTGVIKPSMVVKNLPAKDKKLAIPTKKIGIEKLIKKTAVLKTPTKILDTSTQSLSTQNQKKQAVNKAKESDSKVGKIVKIVTGVAMVGLASFGVYKYVQYRKKLTIKLKK